MLFSLGAGADVAGEDVVVGVVVVVVEVSGAFCSSLAQDAVNAPIATIATPPATAASRRAKRDESMLVPIHMAATSRFLTSGSRTVNGCRPVKIMPQLTPLGLKSSRVDIDSYFTCSHLL